MFKQAIQLPATFALSIIKKNIIEPPKTEWRASHKELKAKLWTLEKQITSVHHHVFLQSKHAVQRESKNNDNVINVENQPKTYNDEDPEKYKCDQCNLGFF